jgi:hypothetical protein
VALLQIDTLGMNLTQNNDYSLRVVIQTIGPDILYSHLHQTVSLLGRPLKPRHSRGLLQPTQYLVATFTFPPMSILSTSSRVYGLRIPLVLGRIPLCLCVQERIATCYSWHTKIGIGQNRVLYRLKRRLMLRETDFSRTLTRIDKP